MTSAKAIEFLTKQLNIEKETVTFRWLSRILSVHVNVAKNELASFYASCKSTNVSVHATYLLTGDVPPVKAAGSYRDNEQDQMDTEDDNQESVSTSKILLVGENDLEESAAKTQFTRVPSVHIYSLSPSAIRDAALLAPMADRVRSEDVSRGTAYNQTIGIVVGPDVKIGQMAMGNPGTYKLANSNPAPAGSSLKLDPPPAAKRVAERPKSSEEGKAAETTKKDDKKKGTLDWSKVKIKREKEQGNEATKKEPKSVFKENVEKSKSDMKKDDNTAKIKKEPVESIVPTKKVIESDKAKRGTKRSSAVMSLSDSEDDNPSPKTKARISATPLLSRPASQTSTVKVKNGVLFSDDEEERVKEKKLRTTKYRGKGRASVAQEDEGEEFDPSLRAMMDLDDSQVISHSRAPASDHQSDEDNEMLSDDNPYPIRTKPKRKPKKLIPMGKNGLPKRRVVKSRKSKNAKGYTITEDYSSYESVSESEQAQATSDTEKKSKKNRKKSMKEDTGNYGVSNARRNTIPKDKVEDQPAKAERGSQTVERKTETENPGSGSGGGSSVSKSGNGGKSNLMNYFTKK